MSGQLEKLEAAEFDKLKECLPEAMKTVTSAWSNSKYYNQVPGRISVLIKKFCFFIIEKVCSFCYLYSQMPFSLF